MKIPWILGICLAFANLNAQKIQPHIISSSGSSTDHLGIYLQWTLGEIIIDYQETDNALISEGFHFVDKNQLKEFFPDVFVTTINVSPSVVPKDETITVTATITNSGPNQAPPSSIGLFISNDNVLDVEDIFIKEIQVEGLLQNGIALISSEIDLEGIEIQIGQHFAFICTDLQNIIEESDEENNCTSVIFEIIEVKKPDLIIENVLIDNSCILPGDALGITFELINQGSTSAPASVISVYLSTDTIRDSSDDRLLSFNQDQSLMPGQSQKNDRTIMISANTVPGNYFLIVSADDFGTIMESNEGNNFSQIAIEIKSNISECLPDGAIQNLSVSNECVQSGLSIDVSYKLKNLSPIRTSRSSSIGHFLSKDDHLDPSDQLLYSRFVPSIDEFSEFDISQNLLIPPNLATGTYQILVCFDPVNVITEENEENNCDNVSIRIIAPGKPDLRPLRITLEDNCFRYGLFYQFDYLVSNDGNSTAEFSTVEYYLSRDNQFSSDDELISSRDIGSIPLCSNLLVQEQIRYSKLVRGGSYFLLVVADGPNDVDEVSETNNVTSFAVQVKIPDIEILKNIPEDTELEAGTRDTFDLKVRNIGNEDAGEFVVGVFLSIDPFFTGDDVLIGQDTVTSLAINETKPLKIPALIPNVSEGTYYLIFRANIFNGINEADPQNSQCVVRVKIVPKKDPVKDVKDMIEYYFFQQNVGELNPLFNNKNGG